ncbi:Uncharacterised protein [marine metagenome]
MPTKTTKQLTTNKRLLTTKADSRLTVENTPLLSIEPARKANRSKDPPTKIVKIKRMKTPRSGSLAKACTEVSTPDRTMKVPIKEKPNARIANKIVQAFNASLFSTTIAECSKATEINHGIRLAFSTGSQNQNPPQPNS